MLTLQRLQARTGTALDIGDVGNYCILARVFWKNESASTIEFPCNAEWTTMTNAKAEVAGKTLGLPMLALANMPTLTDADAI